MAHLFVEVIDTKSGRLLASERGLTRTQSLARFPTASFEARMRATVTGRGTPTASPGRRGILGKTIPGTFSPRWKS